MGVVNVASMTRRRETTATLYEQIGAFLLEHRLDPEPGNYAFAHAIVSNPAGALAHAVSALCDGGVRLTRRDIESLGGQVAVSPKEAKQAADTLVAKTQMQIESFGDTIKAIHSDAQDFGRELAASADAIARVRPDGSHADMVDDVSRITTTMIARVRITEAQLEQATRETAELRNQLEEARDNARRDPLTDLPNRRAFEEAMTGQIAAGVTTCIAVCDVDHFKKVNDRFGHVVGDRVLKAVATTLGDACSGHLVARYGGEEFVVLFQGLDLAEATELLDTARLMVSRKHYKLRETDEPLGEVTFSAGITFIETGEHTGTAFHRADRLLYDAKSGGRNQVRSA